MISDERLPYVQKFKDRHGHERHYFRRNGSRTPLPAPGSPEFRKAYQKAFGNVGADTGAILPPVKLLGVDRKKTRIGLERQRTLGTVGGVYLLMLGSRVVYVGSSVDMPTRVVNHRANGRQFDRAYYISVPAPKDRAKLEATLIAALKPEQNRLGTNGELPK